MAKHSVSEQKRLLPQHRPSASEIVAPGALAGFTGAVAMGLLWMAVSAARGEGFWTPMHLISVTWGGRESFGEPVGVPGGIVGHLLVGVALGLAFAAGVRKQVTLAAEVALALLYACAVFLVMTFVVVPAINPFMAERIHRGWFFVYHLVYGLGLVLVVPVRRKLERRERVTTRQERAARP